MEVGIDNQIDWLNTCTRLKPSSDWARMDVTDKHTPPKIMIGLGPLNMESKKALSALPLSH